MRKYALFTIGLIFFLVISPPVIFAEDDRLELHFIDLGDGESIFIKLPHEGNKNILVDAGGPAAGPGLVEYLRSIGTRRIDHLIFTHPHDDHTGGGANVFSEFEVGNYYDNGSSNFDSTMYEDYLMSVRKDLSRYRVLQAGESLLFGGVKIDVINPILPLSGNLNEDSIVLRVRYGGIAILLAGDMGILGEKRLLNIGTELKSRVLKVGHHGDDDASSKEFLAAVGPQAAVIIVSAGNKYARPEQGTLNRLERAGIKVYRTDLNGHIVLKTDGKEFSLHIEKPLNGVPK
jgi:competence protein ComEC